MSKEKDIEYKIDKFDPKNNISNENFLEKDSPSGHETENYIDTSELYKGLLNDYPENDFQIDTGSFASLLRALEDEDMVVKKDLEKNIIEDTDTLQNELPKTKKTKDEKIKQKGRFKKRPKFFKYLKAKLPKSKKADAKYINHLQKDIDDIADLVSSFKTFDVEKDDREVTKNSVNENDEDSETDTFAVLLPETFRRKSYVPEIVQRGRRKSMLEEAMAAKTEKGEAKEAEIFESLKNQRLDGLKRKGSIVLDLLTPDEDDKDIVKDSGPKADTSNSSFIESFTNLFKSSNKSNNSRFEKEKLKKLPLSEEHFKHPSDCRLNSILSTNCVSEVEVKTHSKGHSYSMPLNDTCKTLLYDHKQNSVVNAIEVFSSRANESGCFKALDLKNDTSHNCFSLCGDNMCLYGSGIGNHVINMQADLVKVRITSRQRIKECLKSIFTINSFLSDYDILQLSLYFE